MSINEAIFTARVLNGLSARQLAAMTGVAPSTVTRIEAGKVNPTWTMASTLLHALGSKASERFESLGAEAATEAAEALLDGVTLENNEWIKRWGAARLIDHTTPRDLLTVLVNAGLANRVASRPGVTTYVFDDDITDPHVQMRKIEGRYAVTGIGALTGELTAKPTIYLDKSASIPATWRIQRTTSPVAVIVIPAPPTLRFDENIYGFMSTSRSRAIADAFAGSGREPDQAEAFIPEFERALAHA